MPMRSTDSLSLLILAQTTQVRRVLMLFSPCMYSHFLLHLLWVREKVHINFRLGDACNLQMRIMYVNAIID